MIVTRNIFVFVMLFIIQTTAEDFWEQTCGPPGGYFTEASSAVNSSGHIFCSALDGFVYRSLDNGLSWEELDSGLERAEYYSLAINKEDHIFIGGWWNHGIYRSSDNGESWTKTTYSYGCPDHITFDSTGALLVAPFHRTGGIIRSTDNGETWSSIGPETAVDMGSIAVNSEGHIFAGAGNGLYISESTGYSWVSTELNFSIADITFNSQGHIYVLRSWSHGSPTLYISTDNGANWDAIESFPSIPDGANCDCIAIDSEDNVFVGTVQAYSAESWGGVYRSTDGCRTWTKILDYECRELLINQNDDLLMFTYALGILHSSDKGDHWQYTGPAITRVNSLSLTANGIIFAGLNSFREWRDAGIWSSSNKCNSWEYAGLSTRNVQCILGIDLNNLLVGTDNGIYSGIYNGKDWSLSALPNTPVTCMVQTLNKNILAGTVGSGLFRSIDNGYSWSFSGFADKHIRSILTGASDTIYIGTEATGIYHSLDNGNTWSFIGLPNTTVTSLSKVGTKIVAGTNAGIYNSTDHGVSWAIMGLDGLDIQDILCTSGDIIYVATSDGVYHSLNEGQTWAPLNSGLNHLNIKALLIDSTGYLYAGTEFGGVYKSKMKVTTKTEESITFLSEFMLNQNYPNPFNPVTVISWQLPVSSHVDLSIYNILGQKVAMLVDKRQTAGSYSVEWDASGFASGVYYYKIEAGEYSEVKKMILIR